MIADPTKRFTDRVSNYVKYRPGYPSEVLDFLREEGNLSEGSMIADVGSGTGIFTDLLLKQGYKVFAVEPNEAMQHAAVDQLGSNKNFTPVNGTAEATTLADSAVEMIVCAQAFHWFNSEKTRLEFKKILKEDGHAALIWNNREADTDEFSIAYESLLKQDSVDYNKVNHRNVKDIDFKSFFRDGQYKVVKYPNEQVFDEDGLLGRAFSSSYVPDENSVDGKKFKEVLTELFANYNKNGSVSFRYQTEVYFGQI
jgi:SAM-dependent methyltransferase